MLLEPISPSVKSYSKSTDTKWSLMKSLLLGFLIFNFSILILQCGLDIEDPTPPSPPVWVQKSLPEEWPERGIDAHNSGGIYGGINLEWEQKPEENIQTYLLYRAQHFEFNDSLGEFDLIARKSTDEIRNHQYLDNEVGIRVQYYYKIKAEDQSGNLSSFSDSIHYSLLPQINFETMQPNGLSDTISVSRRLFWGYYYVEMEDYCLTVLTQYNDLVIRVVLSPVNYISAFESWHFPDSIILESNQIYKWRIDTGGEYSAGLETAGSESPWGTFLFVGD